MTSLAIHADLSCEFDSAPISIRSSGRAIVVDLPDLATGRDLLRLSLPKKSRRRRLQFIAAFLGKASSVVEIRVRNRTVASIGSETGSRLGALLGLPNSSFYWRNLLTAWRADSLE